jgi:hypothetical protein
VFFPHLWQLQLDPIMNDFGRDRIERPAFQAHSG